MKSITRIETDRMTGDDQSHDVRYILSSLSANVEKIMKIARSHWDLLNFHMHKCSLKTTLIKSSIFRPLGKYKCFCSPESLGLPSSHN